MHKPKERCSDSNNTKDSKSEGANLKSDIESGATRALSFTLFKSFFEYLKDLIKDNLF